MRRGFDLDPGGTANVLEQYQRWRCFDTMAMGFATDGHIEPAVLQLLRRAPPLPAMSASACVERLPGLKRLFIREAAGLVGEVPKLLRGEAL